MNHTSDRWLIGLELAAILIWLFPRTLLEAILSAGAPDVAGQAAELRLWAGIAAWVIALLGWHGYRDECSRLRSILEVMQEKRGTKQP